MRIFRKGVKRGVVMLAEKTFNLLVVLALLLQPVGTVGLYGAFSFTQGVVVAADEAPVIEVAPEAEEATPEAEPGEEVVSEETDEVVEVAEEGVVEVIEPVETVDLVAPLVPEALPEEAIVLPVEIPVVPVLEPVTPETEQVPVEKSPVVLIPEEEESDGEVWDEEKGGKKATTKEKVVLGQTYVAPQSDQVTVTFTKLPEHPGTLSIEEVTLSPKQVRELNAFSETAYDVTSSMEDGTFAYVLTLPIPKGKQDVQVKYAEDTADIENAETVARKNIEQKQDTVEVTLDHFTLFVATYGDVAFAVEQSEYIPGDTVYVKATGLNDTKFYKIFINPPTGNSFSIPNSSCFNPGTDVTEYSASYVLPGNAEISNNWAAELKEYGVAGCTGPTTLSDSFIVVAPEEQQHIDVTLCHATPPDTAVNGYTQILTDDDGVLTQGHASQHSADIIPPFTVGETVFPGQNWDAYGQAVWENDCDSVGRLKVLKVADDGADLTQWSFILGEGTPMAASALGEVDFGYVDTGVHEVSEVSIASYSVSDVSGENCFYDEELGTVSATVVSGETTTCTFFNAVDRASLTVVKEALPESDQDFDFSITELEAGFSLDDDGNEENELASMRTFSGLMPGTYTVSEQMVEGWQLSGLSCTSSQVSLKTLLDETVTVTLQPGEHVTCTYTNTPVVSEAVCGDGIRNTEGEECDGTDGVTEGENFCTFSCQLVPVYDGGGVCSKGSEKVLVGSYFVSGTTDTDGISIPLTGDRSYLLEARGDYSYGGVATNHDINRADAGYSSDDDFSGPNLLNTLFGISSGALYRGVHTLISDMGTGTFGVVDWGEYQADHVYPVALSPDSDIEVRFAIADWYDEWYSGDWLSEPNKNQAGYRDNEGGLTVDVYECQEPEEQAGSITVIKDAQPDSAQDFGYAMEGDGFVEFVLDDDADELLSNTATLTNLPVGTYTVTEGLVAGWTLEDISCTSNQRSLESSTHPIRTIELLSGENVVCTFTNVLEETVPVCGDGIRNTEGEACDGTDGVTEGENFCTFSCQLVPIYDGGGVCSEGSEPVLIDTKAVDSFMTDGLVPEPVSVMLPGGKEYLIESVGDFGYGGVATNNMLNRADAGYVSDSNWAGPNLDTLFGTPATALYRGIHSLISDMGTGTFGVVDWGTYNTGHTYAKHFAPVADTEVQFAISDWYDTWYSGDELSEFNKNQYGFRDNEGSLTLNVYECRGRDEEENPQLQLRKSNDSVTDETPGNEVVYTLEVTALGGPVDDVTVTDLPPEGFEYVAGSGTGAPFVHEYASPGIWDVGDMSAGETKTLTYKTTISGAQDAGLYTDLAFAKGMNGESIVYANSEADPFVGTDVNVVLPDTQIVTVPEERDNDRVIKRKTKTQYVLGASTILPMTGVSALPLFLAVAGLLLGGGLLFLARRRMSLPVAVVLAVMGGALWLPGQASAGSLSVNIETPESMVTTPDFQIGFVTLDVLSRPLTVECYKTGVATPFATYALASSFGGNSGNCQVNATVMPSDGTYTFYVKAIASGEGSDSIESSPVSVTLASVPGTPYNYSRTDTACQHTIGFTTANDGGKTVKVVLYRSASTTFTADASTKVDEQAVGSSVTGSFVEGAPGCSDDWFYALQAVDVNGNGSAFVGDVNVTVRKYTVTHRKTKTVTLPGGTSTAPAIAVAPGTSGVGEVQGVETVNETEATVSGEKEERGAGSVLGEMSEATGEDDESGFDLFKNHPWRSLFIAFILLLLGYYGYQYSQKKRYDQSAE